MLGDENRADQVDESAVGGAGSHHAAMNTRSVDNAQANSLIDINGGLVSIEEMNKVPERLTAQITALGISKKEAANRCGLSPQRLGNYASGDRTPDLDTLMRMAKGLGTTCDWLLGFNAVEPPEVSAIVARLCEMAGLPPERAAVVAETAQEALRVLAALPDEGDARTRSRIAAQAAWQLHDGSKLPQ